MRAAAVQEHSVLCHCPGEYGSTFLLPFTRFMSRQLALAVPAHSSPSLNLRQHHFSFSSLWP